MTNFWGYVVVNFGPAMLTLFGSLLLSGCGHSERNVIVNKTPFFHTNISVAPEKSEAVIKAVRVFSNENFMDFLLAQKSLEPGDFNASANSRYLNLKAMRIAAVAKGVDIFAIASNKPTPQQRALVNTFVERIRAAGGG